MSVDERTRHEIHGRFQELLGPELAGAFMSYLPPVGWGDVATKRDLDALRTGLDLDWQREIGALRDELHREVGGLRAELHRQVGGLRAELHREIGGLRGEMHDGLGGLRGEMHDGLGGLRAELTDRMDRHFRATIFALIGSNATLAGLAFAAARMG